MSRTLILPVLLFLALIGSGCDGKKMPERAEQTTADTFAATMEHEHAGDRPTPNNVAWMEPAVPVKTDDVVFGNRDSLQQGFAAWPAASTRNRPGLVVIHEFWGLNDNMRAMTKRLAGEGYLAVAVDLYRGRVAESADSARAFMSSVDNRQALATISHAIDWIREQGSTKVGVIGWCFGGKWSLNTAIEIPEKIDATVIYYGQLDTTDARLKRLDMPVLGIFGESDNSIPLTQVRAFEAGLKRVGVPHQIHTYPGAGHAFANPSGERYVESAAIDAWNRTRDFLAQHLPAR